MSHPRALRHVFATLAILSLVGFPLGSCSRQAPLAPALAPTGAPRADRLSSSGDHGDEVVVHLAGGADPAVLAGDFGATLVDRDDDYACLAPGGSETPSSLAARLSTDSRVLISEPNSPVENAESRQQSVAFDDGGGTYQNYFAQPAAEAIDLDQAQRVSTGQGVRIAILDTGAELAHPALASRIVGGYDFIGHDAVAEDTPDGVDNDLDGRVDEAYGHGTHVAGIVARTAPNAQLLIVRVLDADGRGDIMSVAAGVRWAIDHGARVINMSLGMLRESDLIQDLIDQAEDELGITCVVSAGNWGAPTPQEYPARSSHVLAVAATDADRMAAPFTSYGSFVAISAPGVGVRSSYVHGGYALWSGTSMAAPFVSGTAALLLAIHPGWTQEAVMSRIASTARPVQVRSSDQTGNLGAGVLNAGSALAPDAALTTGPPPLPPLPPPPPTLPPPDDRAPFDPHLRALDSL